MHELSIAQCLVDLIEDEVTARAPAQQRGVNAPRCLRVGRVRVRVGALSGVVPEALYRAFPVAAARSSLKEATLSIEECLVVAWCPACGVARVLPSPQRLRCPACDGPTPDVVGGRELELVSIEVRDDDDDAYDAAHPAAAASHP